MQRVDQDKRTPILPSGHPLHLGRRMPTLDVNDTVIAYEEAGSGPPLILAHGLGLDRTMWLPQIERFRATNRVIAFDVRGAGASGPLDHGRDVLARQADDLAQLLTELDVDRAVLCGVSYGGVLAQEFALTYPHRLSGLVLVDTFANRRLADPVKRNGLRVSTALAVPMLLLPPTVMEPALRRTYARWPLARDIVMDGYRRMRRRQTARMRHAINRADYENQLAGVTCPVQGIVGDDSAVLTELMESLIDALPDASLNHVSCSFDPSNLCQPAHFNEVLDKFLTDLNWIEC